MSTFSKIIVLFLVILSLTAGAFQFARLTRLDGWQGIILLPLLNMDTEYAEGYSEQAFLSIRKGMSETDVRRILGEPLDIREVPEDWGGETYWHYTRSPGSMDYRMRNVIFQNGLVVRLQAEIYLD